MASSGHLRRCSDGDTTQNRLKQCQRCVNTIMANYNGSLEAVECHIQSVRYHMVLESSVGCRLRWPH
eukprot:scaffold4781_cov141-Skeletonema_marinoi.AAC.12